MKRLLDPRLPTLRLHEFPGEIAGASLKRHEPGGGNGLDGGIPRRNRRGLIEANIATA